jgi:ABC-type phosphate transport system permease subunit
MQVVANNMAVQGVQNFANSVAMASSAMSGASSAVAGSIGFVGTVASLGVQLGVALGVLAVVVGSMPSVVGATPKAMRLKQLLAVLEDDSNINRWDDRS